MDIGTAKPSEQIRKEIPHHLIDILDPKESYTASDFVRDAEIAISNILKDGHFPVVVGGSSMYVWALSHGLHDSPGANQELRARSPDKLELLKLLENVDSEAAQQLADGPRHRILRAYEIISSTGMSYQEWQKQGVVEPQYSYEFFILECDREELYERINRRVDKMFDQGLVDEVTNLRQNGVKRDDQSQKAIGYRQTHAYLDGEIDYEETVRLIKRDSRRYAKRQMTWNRTKFTVSTS